jgi:hypothetical protein
MIISGFTGFSFFLIANFTHLFTGSSVLAGCLQLCVNAFVFIVWQKAFRQSIGFKKFVAFVGTVVPVIMASTTLVRVLVPALMH